MSVLRLLAGSLAIVCGVLSLLPAQAADSGALRAGAAKVEITPVNLSKINPNDYGDFAGVHDPVYARALVIEGGGDTAALVSLDLNQIGSTKELRARIQRELGMAADHVVISVTHTHSAPLIGTTSPGSVAKSGGAEIAAYTAVVNDRIVTALRQAKAAMQPARLGVSNGRVDVNVNRNLYTPQGYKYGYNADGPSDKTVWVVKFESATGAPIAVLFNYSVHPVTTRRERLVSADIPGAAERYVEQHYDDKAIALWTLGPSGDQDPKVYDLPTGRAITGFDIMNAQGFMVGAEVVRVADGLKADTSNARVAAQSRELLCPFKAHAREQQFFQSGALKPEEIPGVSIQLGLILVNDIALTAVSGEVSTNIYWHLRRSSPLADTVLITMANDNAGYLVEDEAYDTPHSEVNATPAARGCVENGVVNGLVDMIGAARHR
jgi:hypothetical protein